MTEDRHHGEQQIEVGFDVKTSFFLVKDQRDKNRVFDATVGFFTRPGETVIIPNLFSLNYVYGCLSSGRNIVGYLIPDNQLVFSQDRQIVSSGLQDGETFISSKSIFERCNQIARLMYCDIPNFSRDTRALLKTEEYEEFLNKLVLFYSSVISNCVQVGGAVIFVCQNIVTSARGDVIPLTYDLMHILQTIECLKFQGDIIWNYWHKGKVNRNSQYNCQHKTILMFRKV